MKATPEPTQRDLQVRSRDVLEHVVGSPRSAAGTKRRNRGADALQCQNHRTNEMRTLTVLTAVFCH
jgi:hypothetical protein